MRITDDVGTQLYDANEHNVRGRFPNSFPVVPNRYKCALSHIEEIFSGRLDVIVRLSYPDDDPYAEMVSQAVSCSIGICHDNKQVSRLDC